MHFCFDEALLILSLIPFLGCFFTRLHVLYHEKVKHGKH